MKNSVDKLLLLVAMAILLANCQGDLFVKKYEGYPFFNISADQLDFGLVDVNEELFQDIYIRNLGANDSRMNVFFYLAGDPSFRLLTADEEYALDYGESLLIRVAFNPQTTTLQTGEVVIYYSDRPLREDLNVSTFTVELSGTGRQGCAFPGAGSSVEAHPAKQAATPERVLR